MKINKQLNETRTVITMNQECVCDSSSEYTEEKNNETEQEMLKCNRIFLNFSRDFKDHSAKDSFKIAKVKDLFQYLSERQDLQEMKVSGWLDDGKQEEEFGGEEEEEEEDNDEDDLDSCGEGDSSRRGGGQRFAMSRDFWYRKLNTLKAQKLDEAALETKDLPPDDQEKDIKCLKWLKTEKVFSSQMPENPNEVFDQIDVFDRTVAKPIEKVLKKGFVNVYNNRKFFKKHCN